MYLISECFMLFSFLCRPVLTNQDSTTSNTTLPTIRPQHLFSQSYCSSHHTDRKQETLSTPSERHSSATKPLTENASWGPRLPLSSPGSFCTVQPVDCERRCSLSTSSELGDSYSEHEECAVLKDVVVRRTQTGQS